MKILWSDFAITALKEIFGYYKSVAGVLVAQKIKSGIFQATKQLKKHPYSGHTEVALRDLGEGHRYLVEGNYKIIYRPVKEGLLITDIFDTRQDPKKISKRRFTPPTGR